jgi:hypothetical protein
LVRTVRSTAITSATFDKNARTVTVIGAGTNAGRPVSFTTLGTDNGVLPGVFNLALSDGYAITGSLLSGSIRLF